MTAHRFNPTQAREIESTVEPLEKRCQKLVKGSRKYQEAVSSFADSQRAFAASLEDFCNVQDDDSMLLGAPLISKFVGTFQELALYSELLHTQVAVGLCERFQHVWAKGLLVKVKESQKQLDRKGSEYDSARLKHLGHNKVNAKWLPGAIERAEADMLSAEANAEAARFDAMRVMTELQGCKRFEFLEAIIQAVRGHTRFFENSLKLLRGVEPYLEHAWEVVETLRGEHAQRMAVLEDAIAAHQQMKAAARAEPRPQAATPDARGPLQIAGNLSQLAEEFEAFIRETAASGGAHVTALKQGYLNKRSSNLRKGWKRRFFVLDSQGMLYYYSGKERVDRRKTPQNTVSLITSTIKSGADESDGGRALRFCFRVVSTEKTYLLQADSDAELLSWVTALQGVIATLLGGAIDLARLESMAGGKPQPPTHSRQASVTSLSSAEDALGGSLRRSSATSQDLGSAAGDAGSPLRQRDAAFGGGAGGSGREAQAVTPPTTLARSPQAPPRQGTSGHVIATLRQAEGNDRCADCGAPDPDWASLNLGVLVCIQCSGVHRRMGVHVSKVRSLALDVKVWEGPALQMLAGLGNAAANAVWEQALRQISERSDSWVWNDDSDDDSTPPGRPGPAEGVRSPHAGESDLVYLKPSAQHSVAAKEQFIIAKYSERRFVLRLPPEVLRRDLWQAVTVGDLRGVMRAVAGGADVNASIRSARSARLLQEFEEACRAPKAAGGNRYAGGLPVLFLACKEGDQSVVEFLLQNQAAWDHADPHGRTPLHYAAAFGRSHIAQALLSRGADRAARDQSGWTALDLAIGGSPAPDAELLALLSDESGPRPSLG